MQRGMCNVVAQRDVEEDDLDQVLCGLIVFTICDQRVHSFCFCWLLVIFTFVLINRCGYFGFGFTTLNRKGL